MILKFHDGAKLFIFTLKMRFRIINSLRGVYILSLVNFRCDTDRVQP